MKKQALAAAAALAVWLAGSADVQGAAAEKFAAVTGPGADRHPPLVIRFAEATGPAIDRHPPLVTRIAGLAMQEPIEMVLQVGTEQDDFALAPGILRFEKGKLYKLVMTSPSRITHYVSAPEFGEAIDSMRLTQGLELKPGERQVWYFAAEEAGTYRVACRLMAHAKAGMVGKFIVS